MPVLVMQGDDDGVRLDHSASTAAAVRDGRLAVIPGASHAAPLEKPHLVNAVLLDFLSTTRRPPRRIMPMGALGS